MKYYSPERAYLGMRGMKAASFGGTGGVCGISGPLEPLQRADDRVVCRDFRRVFRLVPDRGRAAGGAGKISADWYCFSRHSSGSHWFPSSHCACAGEKKCVTVEKFVCFK